MLMCSLELLQSFCDNRAPNINESQEASGHIGSATIGLLNYFHNCLPPDLVLWQRNNPFLLSHFESSILYQMIHSKLTHDSILTTYIWLLSSSLRRKKKKEHWNPSKMFQFELHNSHWLRKLHKYNNTLARKVFMLLMKKIILRSRSIQVFHCGDLRQNSYSNAGL